MATPAYMEENNAELARLIKDGAIFIRPVGSTPPTDVDWVPSDTDGLIGYYSDEGHTLTPVPGDSSTFTGHNGDDIHEEQTPGHWTTSFSGLEARRENVEAYFDTEVDPEDGSITVTKASTEKYFDIITAGLDQHDNLALVHYPRVKVNGREGIQFNRTTLMAYAMTFRTFRGTGDAPYHFKAWGMVPDFVPTP